MVIQSYKLKEIANIQVILVMEGGDIGLFITLVLKVL